jgi:hypothetical protein
MLVSRAGASNCEVPCSSPSKFEAPPPPLHIDRKEPYTYHQGSHDLKQKQSECRGSRAKEFVPHESGT